MVERRRLSSDLDRVAEPLERMWGQLVNRGPGEPHSPRYAPPVIEPPTDVYETEGEIVALMEIAGMRSQDVEIQLDGRRMTVRGIKRDRRTYQSSCSYSVVEIPYGPFVRTLLLPAEVDPEQVSVQYDDGMLEIRLPKRARETQRRVRITFR